MTKEEKNLLLKDLCGRLPYGVKVHNPNPKFPNEGEYVQTLTDIHGTMQSNWITFGTDCEEINVDWNIGNKEEDMPKPYLRPMSSMTEEEFEMLKEYSGLKYEQLDLASYQNGTYKCLDFYLSEVPSYVVILVFDWLNAHHFDYRGLIDKGLAFEAPENMYNIKKQ